MLVEIKMLSGWKHSSNYKSYRRKTTIKYKNILDISLNEDKKIYC